MSWKPLFDDLKTRGWTQQLIAERVGASQAAISDLYSGKTKSPSYALGKALEALQESGAVPPSEATAKAA